MSSCLMKFVGLRFCLFENRLKVFCVITTPSPPDKTGYDQTLTSFAAVCSQNRFLNQDLATKGAVGKEVLLNRGRAISTFYHTDLTLMSTLWT